ncbi:MAG: hypothetical protein WCS20_15610 [Alphaproteobacteria bacterium]
MAMIETFAAPNVIWERECKTRRRRAVADLVELVNGAAPGQEPQSISDPILWVHQAFDRYRSGMADNDRRIYDLAKIEHDFIAALCALNFDDTTRQLRLAVKALRAFARLPDGNLVMEH